MPDLDRQAQGLGKHPALLLVDIINSFTDPDCPLGSEAGDVVEANRQLLHAFREKQLPVVFTTVVYHDESQARVFRDRVPALDILEPGTHWVVVDPRLKPRSDEPVIEKQWASGFFKTCLDEYLQRARRRFPCHHWSDHQRLCQGNRCGRLAARLQGGHPGASGG